MHTPLGWYLAVHCLPSRVKTNQSHESSCPMCVEEVLAKQKAVGMGSREGVHFSKAWIAWGTAGCMVDTTMLTSRYSPGLLALSTEGEQRVKINPLQGGNKDPLTPVIMA